jgi:hypothetical protein
LIVLLPLAALLVILWLRRDPNEKPVATSGRNAAHGALTPSSDDGASPPRSKPGTGDDPVHQSEEWAVLQGKLVERGGHRPNPKVLSTTTVEVSSGRQASKPIVPAVTPKDDGAFLVRVPRASGPWTVTVKCFFSAEHGGTLVINEHAQRTLDVANSSEPLIEVMDIEIPEAAKLCWLEGSVYSASGREIRIDGVSLESDAVIEGERIRLASNSPQLGHAPNAPVAYVRSNRFAICHVPSGRYSLTISADGHWSQPRTLDLVQGQGLPGLILLMDETPFAMHGAVTDAETGQPLKGAEVSVFTWSKDSGAYGAQADPAASETTAGETGAFWLPVRQLADNALKMRVALEGYETQTMVVKPVEFKAGFALKKDFQLRREK